MTFLPDGRLLVTEKKGALKLLDVDSKRVGDISGVPKVAYGGQGGFGDVILHPQFAANSIVYVSYSEPGDGDTSGAAVARARLALDRDGGGSLEDLAVIWRQVPKVASGGHWGHRLAFGPDGKLWITSSERQQFTPAQDMKSNLGKVVRLNDDGSVPADNPFYAQGGVTAQIWSLGHRNLLGIAFAPDGRLYTHEMGPRRRRRAQHHRERAPTTATPSSRTAITTTARDIPDHPTRPEFRAPLVTWNPVISPAGFIIYSGKMFPDWNGNGFIGGLSSRVAGARGIRQWHARAKRSASTWAGASAKWSKARTAPSGCSKTSAMSPAGGSSSSPRKWGHSSFASKRGRPHFLERLDVGRVVVLDQLQHGLQ